MRLWPRRRCNGTAYRMTTPSGELAIEICEVCGGWEIEIRDEVIACGQGIPKLVDEIGPLADQLRAVGAVRAADELSSLLCTFMETQA